MLLCTMKNIDTDYWRLILYTNEGGGEFFSPWNWITERAVEFARDKHHLDVNVKPHKHGTQLKIYIKANYSQILYTISCFSQSVMRDVKFVEI